MRRFVLLFMFGMLIPAVLSSAEVFYEEDFEDGADNWELQGVQISQEIAHSGTHSILSSGQDVKSHNARVRLEMPKGTNSRMPYGFTSMARLRAILISITFMSGQTMCGDG